ncbi:cation-translocating P-type ATPase [Dietzia kunjamensis]|uniref:cation-translocating P-type ATPase n=1 Tax=Dietzia TaxID=37914 RepID=UPI0022B51A5C|nr:MULTISPECIES: cation-translocating P-type ATPase [Dietzia]MBB0989960.1 cation-translocating P-type ATPase [Dietzia sp. SLG510A3-30A2]MCZ4539806.1 cation-translocating P-type ATPase [Dietzia maris]MCZ4656715.1 cation-translocating P-type ATPase [Dietzia kunjamensis]MDJ0423061.1 cation-translocating P-type ATPase [Dietzia kunjamensis]
MTTTRTPAESGPPTPWHTLAPAEVLSRLGAGPDGLTSAEAGARLVRHGPNTLPEAERVPGWRRVARLLADPMILVLAVAAAVSAGVSREWETPVVILLVVALNTILNYVQETRAEAGLAALRDMSVPHSRVVRDGVEAETDSSGLVPGDIVVVESGDRVPADGRVLSGSRLQVAEATLTGESAPVDKAAGAVQGVDAPLGDRAGMVFMNTEVTRGRARIVVTGTGEHTEMGAIADLLGGAGAGPTPLQKRIGTLARVLTGIALTVVGLVLAIGLVRGQSWEDMLLSAVSLAVATIPEGLTAVVAFTLAMGASRLAREGAIIKNLAAVETLGSTSHIATDKTGTLTLNEMTVTRIVAGGGSYSVTGTGYDGAGTVLSSDPDVVPDLRRAAVAMALCNDAIVADGRLVGDPTEGALLVAATKCGIDVEGLRAARPRVAQVPFDSAYKFMATVNRAPGGDLVLHVKGATGAVLPRATHVWDGATAVELDDERRGALRADTEGLAASGLRTLLVAARPFGDGDGPPDEDSLLGEVRDLTVLAVLGIVDPPRPRAAESIRIAHQAGISVHMITGDHLVTASAIARDLGIGGEAVSGVDLDRIDAEELSARAARLGVLARVTPEHKIRMVRALQADGDVVAMTGDGVNDAPALRQADIGIAMGITGTDVSKGAADMVLTDDNFSTIVSAVRQGRGIYDNIVRFVKFQLTTAWAFVIVFLASGLLGLATVPFTALQVLLVNIVMDGPPAMALGVEPVEKDAMRRPPRPAGEQILTPTRLVRILWLGVVMAVGTLLVLASAEAVFPDRAGEPLFATTLAYATFVFFQVFNLMNVRSDHGSVFSRDMAHNAPIWVALGAVPLLLIAVVQVPFLQGVFDTTSLRADEWLLATAVASSILWLEELRKAGARWRTRRAGASGRMDVV